MKFTGLILAAMLLLLPVAPATAAAPIVAAPCSTGANDDENAACKKAAMFAAVTKVLVKARFSKEKAECIIAAVTRLADVSDLADAVLTRTGGAEGVVVLYATGRACGWIKR